jgi:FkbM family methyltransferase
MIRNALVRTGYAALRAGMRKPEISLITRFSEQGHLLDLLNNLRVNYVLDVGANRGWFAKHLRMMGYQGHIFCFEPLRADCASISRLARGDPSWQVFNFALGSKNTTKPFNVISPDGNTVLSSFLQPREKGLVERTETIAIRRIDDILDEVIKDATDARIFLKMDTQGYDMEVLKGCVRWIDQVSILQSEISIRPMYDNMPHYTEALNHYESLGFSLMNLYVVNRAQHGFIVEYDCVMARLDRLAAITDCG